MTDKVTAKTYVPKTRLVIIVGNYGSGKTEIAVNLAVELAKQGKRVQIADLDIVNPYFRSREARATMEHYGIRVVMPPGAQQYADLPIILPEIKGMLRPAEDDVTIFDVGGDDVGAKMLSSFYQHLQGQPYSLLQVINSRRPFTDSLEACITMKDKIELSSRLSVTGFVANSHLIDQTTEDIVVEGYELSKKVADANNLDVEFVTAMSDLASSPRVTAINAPILKLERIMLPPWLQMDANNTENNENTMPAARVKPIGQP